MGVGIFGLLEALLIAVAFLCKAEVAAIIMICLTMFVGAAAITIGGLSINPAVLFVPFYALVALFKKKSDKNYTAPSINTGGICLILFIIHTIVITVLMPRLFYGEMHVIWNSREVPSSLFSLLKPGVGNITQVGYLFISALCYFSTYHIFKARQSAHDVRKLILWVAAFNITFSLLDILAYLTQTQEWLNALIRNGNYTMLDGDNIMGIKRAVGTFTEASNYSVFTLGIFAALLALYSKDIQRRKLTGALLFATLFFLFLSLSTTAYVGLFLYIVRLCFPSIMKLISMRGISKGAIFGLTFVCVVITTLVVSYVALDGIALLDQLLFQKADSQSGRERTLLNVTAWSNFLDSYGLGVGMGSTRASSFVLVLLSNVGVVGLVLYSLFLIHSFKTPRSEYVTSESKMMIVVCREGAIGILIAAALSVAIFDLGLLIYVLAGAASALASLSKKEKINYLVKKQPVQSLLNRG